MALFLYKYTKLLTLAAPRFLYQQYFFFCFVFIFIYISQECSPVAQMVRCLPAIRETRVRSWVGKISWRRKRPPTPVLLPEESHGQRSLVGYTPWGRKESEQMGICYFYCQGKKKSTQKNYFARSDNEFQQLQHETSQGSILCWKALQEFPQLNVLHLRSVNGHKMNLHFLRSCCRLHINRI